MTLSRIVSCCATRSSRGTFTPASLAKRPRLGRSRPLARARSKTTGSAKPGKLSAPPRRVNHDEPAVTLLIGGAAGGAPGPAATELQPLAALADPPDPA